MTRKTTRRFPLARKKAHYQRPARMRFERLEDRALLDASGLLSPLPSEVEPNDTLATANSAAGNFVAQPGTNLYHLGVKADSTSAFEVDYFHLGKLQPGDVLYATLSGLASFRGANTDPILKLYQGSQLNSIDSDDDGGPGLDALIFHFTIEETDDYYLEMMNADIFQPTGSYDLGIFLENTDAAPLTGGGVTTETELNDTIATATDISTSWRQVQFLSRTSASITAGDVDVYSYSLTAGDLVSINIDSTSELEARFNLKDAAGNILAAENGESRPGDSPLFSFIITQTGTYFVEVSAASGEGTYNADVYLSTDAQPPENASPVVASLSVTSPINENDVATVSGVISDTGADQTHAVVIEWGPGEGSTTLDLAAGQTTFSASHRYRDDNPTGTDVDTYPIRVTVTDSLGASGSDETAVTVANVAPVISHLSNSTAIGSAAQGQTVIVGAAFSDTGRLDTHTALIHWGDGTSSAGSVSSLAGLGLVTGNHAYAAAGSYTITVELRDDDLGIATRTSTAMVSGVGVSEGVLRIVGDNRENQVKISKVGTHLRVEANFLSGNKLRTFAAAGITRVEAQLFDGKDQVQVTNDVVIPISIDAGAGDDQIQSKGGNSTIQAGPGKDQIQIDKGNNSIDGGDGDDQIQVKAGNNTIYGGAGNDKIQAGDGNDFIDGGSGNDEIEGGRGSNVLLGGEGNDKIKSGLGRDLIIGGTGADRLEGRGSEDILIGGTTQFDANRTALLALLAEWNSNRSLAQRVANIRNGTGTILAGVKPQKNVTVFDDGAVDHLIASAGLDWFFQEAGKDKISGAKRGSVLN